MMKREAPTSREGKSIVRHLAFATISAAILAEALVASTIAASSQTNASLLTSEPVHLLHFNAVAVYFTIVDYAEQLLRTII
ncbi:MAG: hypothetical protein GC190_13270 [Alphaproteobacteria bacterium]|nr:hypothetical protein [Alphaproteobacteria bacterium]